MENLGNYYFDNNQTIAKNLYLNYTMDDLLEAVLLHEIRFRLKNAYNLDEKTIEENYEKLENIIYETIDIFNYNEIDKAIDKYFKLKNINMKGK